MNTKEFTDKKGMLWQIDRATGDFRGHFLLHPIGTDIDYLIPEELMIFCVGELVREYRHQRVDNLTSRELVTLPEKLPF